MKNKSLLFALTVLTIAGVSLWYFASTNKTQAQDEQQLDAQSVVTAPAATFVGTGTGPIPDGTGGCGGYSTSTPLNITFNVTGLSGSVTNVAVQFEATHTQVGDLRAILIAPGGSPSHILFSQTGATSATDCGSRADLRGLYRFEDISGGGTNWWAAAAVPNSIVAPGTYRTTQSGPQPTASFSPTTSINAAFTGVTNPNGTWTLRFLDGAALETGSVSGATLDIQIALNNKPCFDFYRTGRTSFAVVERVSPSSLAWTLLSNPAGSSVLGYGYGLQSDVLTPGYFVNNDNAADLGVWRPSNQTYYFQSVIPIPPSSNPLNPAPFGSASSDLPGLEADYDGDGRDDLTIVKVSGTNYVWYVLKSNTNTLQITNFGTTSSDFPIAGADYNGDGRADLTVIRSGNTYIVGDVNTGNVILTQTWGTSATDYFVVGDFVGDSKADFAVWRGFSTSANGRWYIRENTFGTSNTPTIITSQPFGIVNDPNTQNTKNFDQPLCGDYNGDGKSDLAIYRPTNDTFYWLSSPSFSTPSSFTMPAVTREFAIPRLRAY